jgi:hypothetical protein
MKEGNITDIEINVNSESHKQQIRRYYSYWWRLMKNEDHKITYFCLHDFKKISSPFEKRQKVDLFRDRPNGKGIVWQWK